MSEFRGAAGARPPRLSGALLRATVASLLLAAVTLWTYRGVFGVYFLGEDFTWLWRCRLGPEQSWWHVLTHDVMVGIYSWRPLVQLSFAWNEAWSGLDLTSYRAEGLCWHLTAALALLGIGWRVSNLATGIVAAAVYAVHPLQVEPLAWTCARGSAMSVAFATLTVLAHLLWRDRRLPMAAVFLPFALALATQETAVLVLGVLIGADLLLPGPRHDRRRTIALYAVLLGIVAIAVWARTAQSPAGVAVPFGQIGSGAAALAGRAWFALGKLPRAVAAVLTLAPPAGDGDKAAQWLGGLLFLSAAAAALWRWSQRRPVALWALGWLCLTLAPYLAFLLGPFPRHFTLALAGVGLLVGELVGTLWRRGAAVRLLLALLGVFWLLRVVSPTQAEISKYQRDGEITRQLLAEMQQLVPRPSPGATFAFYRLGGLRADAGILVYGLDDAVRLLYDDGSLNVLFPELGKDRVATYQLLYEDGHLRRLSPGA